MAFGRHLHELWRLRAGLVACVVLAGLAALSSVLEVGLVPPSLKPRVLEVAEASAHVLIDTPTSALVDLGVSTGDLGSYNDRALLVSNIMASARVRRYIARRARVPAHELQVRSPATPEWPPARQRSDAPRQPGNQDRLRLSLQSNPTVPIVDVYAQADTPDTAAKLANAAVDGMKDYVRDVSEAEGIRAADGIRLEQLGRAKGALVDHGVRVKVALLSFLVTFAVCAMATLFFARVRRTWGFEARGESVLPSEEVGTPPEPRRPA